MLRVFLLCHPGHFSRCSMNSWLINEPFVQIFSPFPSPTPNSLSRAQLSFLILSPMQVTHSTTFKESQDQNYSQYLLYLNTILTSLSIRHNRCFFKFCLLNSKIRVMLGLFSINCLFSWVWLYIYIYIFFFFDSGVQFITPVGPRQSLLSAKDPDQHLWKSFIPHVYVSEPTTPNSSRLT